MNILMYDLENFNINTISDVVNYLNSNNFEVLAIPKDMSLLIDCDTFTLNIIKEKIEAAIRDKEIINGN